MKRIIQIIIASLILTFQFTTLHAQVAINEDNSEPDASAMLDVSSTDKGMLVPRMTSAQRTAIASGTPATGLLVFDNDTATFWFFDGTNWVELTTDELADADGDTKVEVERNTDEDIIRFNVGGTQVMKLKDRRIEIDDSRGNSFIGTNSGQYLSSGFSTVGNTAYGYFSLEEITDGNYNTALGISALRKDTSGFRNTGIGAIALFANTNGNWNTAVGSQALGSNTTGDYNVALGGDGLFSNSAGNNNVAIGYAAGYTSTGSSNVFLGYNAGLFATGDNKLYIENSDSNSPLIYGEFDNDLVRINGTLDVTGDFLVDATIDDDGDTKIQVEESADEDVIRFDVAGTEFLTLEKTNNDRLLINIPNNGANVFLGEDAGARNTSGADNVFVGDEAGFYNSTGGANVGLGTGANFFNASGGSNVALGYTAGYKNTAGAANVYVGRASGFENEGSENVFIGRSAAFDNSTGSSNTVIGTYAGTGNQGSSNVFLGYYAGFDSSGDNKLYIENSSSTTPLVYGEFDNDLLRTNGTFEVKNATPEIRLTDNRVVTNDNDELGRIAWWSNDTSGDDEHELAYIRVFSDNGSQAAPDGRIEISTVVNSNGISTENTAITIERNGKVGINRVPTTNQLEVEGEASKASAGDWIANSDARLKKNIQSLGTQETLEKLLRLQGVSYEWNDNKTGTKRPTGTQYGFTAQNIQDVYPDLVQEDNLGYLQTAYGTYDAMYVEAIRALNDRIEQLEAENAQLKALAAEVAQIKAILRASVDTKEIKNTDK